MLTRDSFPKPTMVVTNRVQWKLANDAFVKHTPARAATEFHHDVCEGGVSQEGEQVERRPRGRAC